ncbi:uncharacterized protein EV669_10713 [Gulbenkiania mobilis]|uniref:HD domain-containing protein n=2 Tax=Gulbenkiania mobilis TaxID=397457 RepID=A0ABY2CVG1_GULMO|nr:uncharacterized protein EV669_10713 [Gulbenkiania mobilis]
MSGPSEIEAVFMIDTLHAHWRPRLLDILATEAGEADGAHDTAHFDRVWQVARALLLAHTEADPMVVMAACYLHDLVNLPKNHPERHLASQRSAERGRAHLQAVGFPEEKLDAVAHAIEAHSYSAGITPHSIEARIVQDADRMDALGAVGLARLFYTAGRMGATLAHPTDPLGGTRPLDDLRYALDHIAVKLEKLPETMQTEAGQRLAEARLERVRRFRDDFMEEWQGQ